MWLLTKNNPHVQFKIKGRHVWKPYKGQKLKAGRIFRHGHNTYGRGFIWDTVAKHNTFSTKTEWLRYS